MQDTIEPGLFAFPTAEGSSQARACLIGLRKRSGSSAGRLDHQVATWLRRQGVVTVSPAIPRKQAGWNDWYGNLEATPPHTDRQGRRFPYGRVIIGKHNAFYDAPRRTEIPGGARGAMAADRCGHVLAVDRACRRGRELRTGEDKAGFKVLLPSPKAARDMLQALSGERAGQRSRFLRRRKTK